MASLFDYLSETEEQNGRDFNCLKFYIFNYINQEKVSILNTYDIFDLFQFIIIQKNIFLKKIEDQKLLEKIKNDILEEVSFELDVFKLSYSFRKDLFEELFEEFYMEESFS